MQAITLIARLRLGLVEGVTRALSLLALPADSVPFRAPTEGEQRRVGSKAKVPKKEISTGGNPPALSIYPSLKGETTD